MTAWYWREVVRIIARLDRAGVPDDELGRLLAAYVAAAP